MKNKLIAATMATGFLIASSSVAAGAGMVFDDSYKKFESGDAAMTDTFGKGKFLVGSSHYNEFLKGSYNLGYRTAYCPLAATVDPRSTDPRSKHKKMIVVA